MRRRSPTSVLVQRDEPHAPALVGARVLGGQVARDAAQVGLGLREGRAGRQARQPRAGSAGRAAGCLGKAPGQDRPARPASGIAKSSGMTPTMRNGRRSSVTVRPTTPGIAAEAPLPERVAEHDHRVGADGAAALLKRRAAVSSGVKSRPSAAGTPSTREEVLGHLRRRAPPPTRSPSVSVRPIV